MKLTKYIGWAALSVLMAACQNDMLVENLQPESGTYTLMGQINNKGTDSRAQIVLNNPFLYQENFYWNEGDRFAMYRNLDGAWKLNEFEIDANYKEESRSYEAQFLSVGDFTPTGSYQAFYPANLPFSNESVSFTLAKGVDFTNALTDEDKAAVWKDYFNNNMFMMATGDLKQSSGNYVSFEHLCALARISYVNQTGAEQAIRGFSLAGDNLMFPYYKNLYLPDGTWSVNQDDLHELYTDGLTVADKDTVDLYMFFFPQEFSDGNLTLKIMHGTAAEDVTIQLPMSEIKDANPYDDGFKAGMRYWFDVTETEEGLEWSKNKTLEGAVIIENLELSQILLEKYGDYKVFINEEGYAQMTKAHADAVTELDLGFGRYTGSSLKGIEHFSNLKLLSCSGSGLETADLSKNTKLQKLLLGHNELLVSLNLTGCNELMTVSVGGCGKLTELNIENKGKLEVLDYSHTEIDIPTEWWPKFTSLTSLGCAGRFVGVLDIPTSVKGKLTSLVCQNNQLNSLNLTEFPELRVLECYDNNLTDLDLVVAPKLQTLRCFSNKIKTLEIASLNELTKLDCGKQKDDIELTLVLSETQKENWFCNWINSDYNVKVDLDGHATIRNEGLSRALQECLGVDNVTLYKGYAVMTKEYAESVTELNLTSYASNITSLDGIEKFTNLSVFVLNNSTITSADFTKNTKLTRIDVAKNALTSLNVTDLSQLQTLAAWNNSGLGTIDLTGCTGLKALNFNNTSISSVEVPEPSIITSLHCNGCQITSLDLTEYSALSSLLLNENPITSLVLPVDNVLSEITVNNGKLTSLDVSNCENLTYILCERNMLKELDLRKSDKLGKIYCGNQKDAEGNDIILLLKLHDSLHDDWKAWSHGNPNVELYELKVEEGSGSTGGDNFNGVIL